MARVASLALCLLAGLVACGEVSKNRPSADGTAAGGTGAESGSSGGTGSGPTNMGGVGGAFQTGGAPSVVTAAIGAGGATTTSGTAGESGESGEAGAPGTGGGVGGEQTDGTAGTTTGGMRLCDCDASPVLVCGVDGNTYDSACGDDCVPVEVACLGACPCAPCHCVGVFDSGCDVSMENDFRCTTTHLDSDLAEDYGCWVRATDLDDSFGPVSVCCPFGYDAQDLCLDD